MSMHQQIIAFVLYCLAIFHIDLRANIVEISNLNKMKEEVLRLDPQAFVLFDVDYTLLIPNDAILRPCGQPLVKKWIKEILENPMIVPLGKYPEGYLLSKTLLKAQSSLLDEQSLSLIQYLQEKKIRTIAFTALSAGKLGVINNMADWRICELKKFGFDFTSAFPEIPFLAFPKRAHQEENPIFKSGILFSAKHPKGEVLKQFLNTIKWFPSKVILIDDRIECLESVAAAMQAMEINFTGFHYLAAHQLPCQIDQKVAKYQFEYLAHYGEWLSDEEANKLLQTELTPHKGR